MLLCSYEKVSGYNERTGEVREARGLLLADRPHSSTPAVSMLILAGAPRALRSFGPIEPSLTVTNWLPAWPSAARPPSRQVFSNNNGQQRQHYLEKAASEK